MAQPQQDSPPPPPPSAHSKMSDGEKFLEDLRNNPNSVSILVGILVGVITLILIFVFTKRKLAKGRVVALAGVCESGKTYMFGKLLYGKEPEDTYTSIKENRGVYTPRAADGSSRVPLEVVDLPGHERLRQAHLQQVLPHLRAVIYLVDSSTVQKQLRDVAEFLFAILTEPRVADGDGVRVLVACNKQDLPTSKGSSVVRRELEKELQLLKKTKSRSLEGTGGDSDSSARRAPLGLDGKEDFSFDDLPNNKVCFAETSSVGDDGLADLEAFLVEVA